MCAFKRLPLVQIIASALALGGYCTTGFGADDDDVLGSMSLEKLLDLEVVTASKTAQKTSDAPATVYVVTADQIANRGYRHLVDLLEDIPEVEIQEKAVAEYNNYFTFRGIAGNDKFVVLLDGFRINSPTGSPHAIATNYGLANAKRVEVIMGPASALYGADAFGGIINIITRAGEDADGASVHVGFGQFDTQDTSVSYGVHKDDFSLMFLAQFYGSDEPNFSKEYPNEYAWYNDEYRRNGHMRLAPFLPDIILTMDEIRPYETPTKSHFYHLGVRFGKLEMGFVEAEESHNSSVGMLPEYNLYVRDAVYATKVNNLFVKHQYSMNESLSFQTSLSQGRFELLPESKFLNTFTGYRDGYKYEYGTDTKFEEQLNWLINDSNTIVAGLTYEEINALPKTGDLPFAFDPDTPAELQGLYYLGTNITDANGNDLTVPQVFYNISYKNTGVYTQLQSAPFEDWKFTLGARYDDNTRYGSTFNPRAGAVYKPSSQWTFKLLYSTGFFAPSPYLAFQHYGGFIPQTDTDGNVTGLFGAFWHLPNPDLKPEKLKSSEFSAAYSLSDHYKLSLNYYHTKITDLISPKLFFAPEPGVFDGTFQGWPVGTAEIPVNQGESTIDGSTLRLDTLHQVAGWTLNGLLNFSHSDGDKFDNDLTYSAKQTWKAGMEISRGGYSIFPKYLRRSKSLQQRVDGNGEHLSNQGYDRWDLYGQFKYKVGDDMSLAYFVKLSNVFDKKYTNVTFAQDEAFAAAPQDPRRIEIGVEFKM